MLITQFSTKSVYAYNTHSVITTICFTICLFISPDLDGYRAPRGIYPTRPTRP